MDDFHYKPIIDLHNKPNPEWLLILKSQAEIYFKNTINTICIFSIIFVIIAIVRPSSLWKAGPFVSEKVEKPTLVFTKMLYLI